MIIHPLHETTGKIIKELFKTLDGYELLFDPACKQNLSKSKQNLPLFSRSFKANTTEYCNVDILIKKEDKVKIIIEIDESNLKPTQVFGKFLTSALSSYYIDKQNNEYPFDDSVLFIQIMGTIKLDPKSSKINQWQNMEESINSIIPLKNSKILKYKLLHSNISDASYESQLKKGLKDTIYAHLKP